MPTFIRCEPAIAFDLLTDARNEARWNARVTSAELRAKEKNDVTLAEYDRPGHAMVAATSAMMDIDSTDTSRGSTQARRLS